MKYSIFTKFVAIVLCAVSLVVCAAGAAGIIISEDNGLYTNDVDNWLDTELTHIGYFIARDYCSLYVAEHLEGFPEDVLEALRNDYFTEAARKDYAIEMYQDGTLLAQGGTIPDGAVSVTLDINALVPYILDGKNSAPTPYYTDSVLVYDADTGEYRQVDLALSDGPEYRVKLYLDPDLVDDFQFTFINTVYQMRYHFITMLAVGLLCFAAILVYLCCAAGRHPKSSAVYPVALNRLPLDLYAAIIIPAEVGLSWLVFRMLGACFDYGGNWAITALIALGVFIMALLVVGYIFALAAQMKTKGGLWWRKTVIFFLLSKIWLVLKYIGRGIKWLGQCIISVINMLPLVWQWVGILVLMVVVPPLFLFAAQVAWGDFWILFWMLLFFVTAAADIALLGWWVWYMGQILKGVAIMSKGNLNHQIPTRFMFGKFRGFADSLNSMAEASRQAVEQQLRSERMKTELITNVSHDIKTPLTSIINYVDLLKKPHSEAEGQQYLEVLDRQSQKLKKLIVDLMDMSKASTGNMKMELAPMDAVEAVNQALGEFSDKLNLAGLQPLFRCSHETVMIRADGRLLWRVLSNLLGNTVKYAMPGTRMYVDLMTAQGNAILSIKNISRDELNVDAEELLERFVRGDTSRNTEGSGLGLNIAKSLVELQGGQMHLTVDGDLFKVTIVMPLCSE